MSLPVDPSVCVVIPARDAAGTLGAQLAALSMQRGAPPFRVIVVDNGSVDDTAAIASGFDSPTMPVAVVHEAVAGINHARNAGVRTASEIVLLCDADDEVSEGWVETLVTALVPGTWVAGPLDFRRLNSERTRALWGGRDQSPMSGPVPFRDSGNGSNCGFFREMWTEIGEFDPSVVGHGDESEFFARAWAGGYQLQWAPSAVVNYRQRSSARAMLRRRFRQGRSQVRIATRPEWPEGAPIPSLSGALRSVLGGARMILMAAVGRRAEWPGAAAIALNLGRLWQLCCTRIGHSRSAPRTRRRPTG